MSSELLQFSENDLKEFGKKLNLDFLQRKRFTLGIIELQKSKKSINTTRTKKEFSLEQLLLTLNKNGEICVKDVNTSDLKNASKTKNKKISFFFFFEFSCLFLF